MPKMKTHRGAAKRLRKTATGRITHQKRGKRHILTKKNSKRKRQLRRDGELTGGDRARADRLIPYL
jgi:large subunit ribosomal protein L35